MRVLAHLSDLHFGRAEPALLEPLRRRLESIAPDLVVVSGDLTQRARRRQFCEARRFLDTLPRPQFVVPGNHDVPLFNVFARFLRPLAGYRRIIAEDVDPSYIDEEIAVLGLNTARSFTWKAGGVSEAQLGRVEDRLRRVGGRITTILVTHHLLPELAGCGFDVLIAGHAHTTRVEPAEALMVRAGTATSRRTRAEPNGFNVLRIDGPRIAVEHHAVLGGRFVRAASENFRRVGLRWRRDGCP
jgi:predicted phosphodiesterase